MTMPEDYTRAVTALKELQPRLAAISDNVAEIRTYGESNRKRIWSLIGVMAFDILLSVGTLIGLHIAIDASSNATAVHNFEVSFCQSSNVSRSQTNGLFDFLFNELLFSSPKITHEAWEAKLKTPAAQDTVAGIYYRVAETYAARNCQAQK